MSKDELIESLSNPVPPVAAPQSDGVDVLTCKESLEALHRKNKINEGRIKTHNAEISELRIDRVKARETFLQETVELEKKSQQVTAIGEVDIVLTQVTENKLNVNFNYIIHNKKYSEIYVPTKTIVGRRIGSFLYLFEILESSSGAPELATIKVMRISVRMQKNEHF